MDRNEILNIVNEIYFGPQTNISMNPLLSRLNKLLPDSKISDLIFHDKRNLSPEQVVDEGMQRQREHHRKMEAKPQDSTLHPTGRKNSNG